MSDTKALRTRIKSVDSTLHLTKAMGLVASSKLRRSGEAMMKGRDYAASVRDVIARLALSKECEKSVFMRKASDDIAKTRIIVIAGDRGMAGGYNANIFRLASEYKGAQFIPIGKRACDRFACDRFGSEANSSEHFSSDEAGKLAILNEVVPEYVAGILVADIRESFASEVAARRNAMDSAGKNASDMIERLQLEYNRARQGAITQEITEIVAGASN